MKIFASGSCRLLTSLKHGVDKIKLIHCMFHNFVGINFLGKLHNTKQHIQFIKWIKDEIELPPEILASFLTSYSNIDSRNCMEDFELNPIKKQNIKNEFDNCDCYIFEICSLKLYTKNDYQVQYELTNDYIFNLQTETDLYNDLLIIKNLIPKNKKIIFQIHFRPNIIYNNDELAIKNREILYNVINNFCNSNDNIYLSDPSVILNKNNQLLYDDTHFNGDGYLEYFNYLFNNFIKK